MKRTALVGLLCLMLGIAIGLVVGPSPIVADADYTKCRVSGPSSDYSPVEVELQDPEIELQGARSVAGLSSDSFVVVGENNIRLYRIKDSKIAFVSSCPTMD